MTKVKQQKNRQTRVSQKLNFSNLFTQVDLTSCKLVVLNGVDKGASLLIKDQQEYYIGAGEDNDLQLSDATISSKHVRVVLSKNGLRIIDLNSTNGCFYQKSQFSDITLPLGATVSLGRSEFKILPFESEIQVKLSTNNRYADLIGHSHQMRSIFSLLADISSKNLTVLIEGETGTGKELIAKALHEKSQRSDQSFVVFDCSSVPPEMIESALFGHLKGSGHGRQSTRLGAFRSADGGTLFLDEIGELPLSLQPKLLRVLDNQNIQMLGTDRYHKVNVRVVAATNHDLKRAVREKIFREDLYYRLAVIRIKLPPLRERLDDIQPLIEHFMSKFSNEMTTEHQEIPYIEPDCYQILHAYDWPGNVRELKNLVHKAISISSAVSIDLAKYLTQDNDHFATYVEQQHIFSSANSPNNSQIKNSHKQSDSDNNIFQLLKAAKRGFELPDDTSFKELKSNVINAFESQYFELLIHKHRGNISKAAQYAQMDRKHLRTLLKKHDLWKK